MGGKDSSPQNIWMIQGDKKVEFRMPTKEEAKAMIEKVNKRK